MLASSACTHPAGVVSHVIDQGSAACSATALPHIMSSAISHPIILRMSTLLLAG